MKPFDKVEVRKALNMADQQTGHPRRRVRKCRYRRQSQPDPAHHVVVQHAVQLTILTIRKQPRRCLPMLAFPTSR
jgi:hypothetical protein